MKICSKCSIDKKLEDFYPHPRTRDGRQSSCKACCNIATKSWSKRNPEKVKEYDSKKHCRDRDRRNKRCRDWYASNKQAAKENNDRWRKENKEREKELKKLWKAANPGKVNANTAERRAQQAFATPRWLSKEHKRQIREFYVLAQELQWLSEEPLEVDHIMPLKGENSYGLHVPWNLQILPRSLNRQKSNKT